MIGAEVYATIRTADGKQSLIEHFKIPEDHIFFGRNGNFAKGIKRMTQGKGVDVILSPLPETTFDSLGIASPAGVAPLSLVRGTS